MNDVGTVLLTPVRTDYSDERTGLSGGCVVIVGILDLLLRRSLRLSAEKSLLTTCITAVTVDGDMIF